MPSASSSDVKFEIGHVLFIDIVGYSKLLINEQSEQLQKLKEIVWGTEQFRQAQAEGKLMRLPTGDGGALVFRTNPEAPVLCAMEIGKELKRHPELLVRMGIHSGPVNEITDLNAQANIAGAGINVAQRVMDCGDAGHILLSKHVADDLEQYRQWRSHLHDLGECEVKHDVRVHVVNLYTDELGNQAVPEKLQQAKKGAAPVVREKKSRSWIIAVAAVLVAALIIGGVLFSRRSAPVAAGTSALPTPPAPPAPPAVPTPTAAVAIPEKSIAVLPFENLSEDKANAYFAQGIQDEILTRLAKVGALKVISHTSTQQYQSKPGNLSEIGRQLGVANILEGSVQKAGDVVRINVQLIQATNDSHLWAETYDRKLTDIFGVESDVAKAIAEALQAKLTGPEKTTLERKPTTNLEAYDAYLRGLAYSLRLSYEPEDMLNAIKYFGEAARLDPKFALAWAWLARANARGYFYQVGNDVPALREAAKRAANKAIELEPDLGEAHLAQGYSHYYCERDYDSAIASFKKAGQLLPNNSQIPQALGRAYRRKGEWQRSLEYYRQAIELDPGDASLRIDQANIFWNLRQFPAALKACDQILDIIPGNSQALATKAGIYQAQGNLPAAAALLSPLHPETNSSLYRTQIDQLIYERRYADAIAALKSALKDADPASSPVDYLEARLAWLQQLSGDATAARVTWQQVRSEAEDLSRRRNLSKPGRSLAEDFGVVPLASAYVALGDKAKAFAIVRQEQDVLASKDALVAARLPEVMAKLAVQAGEKDLALEQLAIAAQNPVSSSVTYGDLKLNPWWDPLRGDPRFEKIVASLAPKQ